MTTDTKTDVAAFVRDIENTRDINMLSDTLENLAREILVSDSTARALKSEAMVLEGAVKVLKMKHKVVRQRLMALGA
jgi:hypothetical protein